MADITALPDQRRDPRLRIALVAVLIITFMAAMAAEAGATIRFEHHTDPAGEMTPFTYNLLRPDGSVKSTTQLDSRAWNASFGPGPGTWVMQAVPPAGWRVVAIKCTDQLGGTAGVEAIDVANGRATINHTVPDPNPANNHHVCAFTNARVGAVTSAAASGVAPTPVVAGGLSSTLVPTRTAVSRVVGGRRSATATVRLARRAVIRATLLNGRRVVGTRRAVRAAGEHQVKVNIARKELRRLRARGRKRATLRLRVVLAEQGGATRVFNIRVLVRLT